MDTPKLFQSLSINEKIDFFLKCQELLINNHPNSDFLFRYDNVDTRLSFAKDFIKSYKGYVYYNDSICILFNRVSVSDPKDPIKTLKAHIYQKPKEDFNCISVDFVVFRKITDCLDFCRSQYQENITYLLFVKNNEVKIYETKKLLEKAVHFNVGL